VKRRARSRLAGCAAALAALLLGGATPLPAQDDVVLRAMRDELARSMDELRLRGLEKPYFIAYRVREITGVSVSASFGGLMDRRETHARWLSVEVRVGDYDLDNTNFLNFAARPRAVGGVFGGMASLPLDADYAVLRRQMWLATDDAYKQALEDLSRKRAALQGRTLREQIPDFSRELPVSVEDRRPPVQVEPAKADALVRDLSALFRQMPDVFASAVSLEGLTATTRYVNSEGTVAVRDDPLVTVKAVGRTQAADGMPLEDFVAVHAPSMAELPSGDELAATVRGLGATLAGLRAAPPLDRYQGPVLFEGQAAAELFGQVFAPNLLAVRRPLAEQAQYETALQQGENPFLDRIGARVLPAGFDVVDAPTRAVYGGARLIGGYRVDDEGVLAREVLLVEQGVLKALLATRTPVRGVTASTGHRTGAGPMPSNLVVTARNGLGDAALRAELLRVVRERGNEYGIIVRRLANPALRLSRGAAAGMEGFRDRPAGAAIVAVKVFPDGREELVRNAAVAGLTAAAFKDILAASAAAPVHTTIMSLQGGGGFSLAFLRQALEGSNAVVSLAVPSLLFEDVTLRAVSREAPRPPATPHPHFDR
jgi:hypothetical protein